MAIAPRSWRAIASALADFRAADRGGSPPREKRVRRTLPLNRAA
jgi:hypothetical protein